MTIGATQLTLTNSVGLLAGNVLDVTVVKGPTVLLEDDFAASKLDVNKWLVNTQAFETGTGPFQVTQTGGALQIGGIVEAELWPGASIQTLGDFTASKDLPLQLEVDRVTMNRTNYYETDFSTGTRSGVFITSYDNDNKRTTPYVFFSQDLGASESVTGWKVNVSATGDGIALAPLAGWNDDTKNHRLKLLADGSKVEVFLDDVSGGSFDFAVGSYIRFELGTYARSVEDTVKATFDNIKIQNVLPCIAVTPTDVLAIQGDTGNSATVTIPKLLNVGGAVKVTVTSRDPSVAEPQGAVNGVLPLDFATGNNVLSFKILAKSAGNTVFDLQSDSGTCVASGIKVAVTTAPQALMSDDFAAGSIDTAKWTIDPTPLVEGGTMTAESAVKTVDGMAELDVKCEASNWPGYTVWTKTTYAPSVNSPIVFEIDRAKMTYTLVGGDASKQRTGIWIKDAAGHYVFFSEFGELQRGPARLAVSSLHRRGRRRGVGRPGHHRHLHCRPERREVFRSEEPPHAHGGEWRHRENCTWTACWEPRWPSPLPTASRSGSAPMPTTRTVPVTRSRATSITPSCRAFRPRPRPWVASMWRGRPMARSPSLGRALGCCKRAPSCRAAGAMCRRRRRATPTR